MLATETVRDATNWDSSVAGLRPQPHNLTLHLPIEHGEPPVARGFRDSRVPKTAVSWGRRIVEHAKIPLHHDRGYYPITILAALDSQSSGLGVESRMTSATWFAPTTGLTGLTSVGSSTRNFTESMLT